MVEPCDTTPTPDCPESLDHGLTSISGHLGLDHFKGLSKRRDLQDWMIVNLLGFNDDRKTTRLLRYDEFSKLTENIWEETHKLFGCR